MKSYLLDELNRRFNNLVCGPYNNYSEETEKKKKQSASKCQWCGSEDGEWTSIYDWHCHKCGKVTID